MIRKSKIYVDTEKFYTIEEIRLNYHCEYLVCKDGKKDGTGEYFRTLEEAIKYVANNCNY